MCQKRPCHRRKKKFSFQGNLSVRKHVYVICFCGLGCLKAQWAKMVVSGRLAWPLSVACQQMLVQNPSISSNLRTAMEDLRYIQELAHL